MSTTMRKEFTTPNSKSVLWLVYRRGLNNAQLQVLVRARLWYEAREKGSADLGLDRQYVDAVLWRAPKVRKTCTCM